MFRLKFLPPSRFIFLQSFPATLYCRDPFIVSSFKKEKKTLERNDGQVRTDYVEDSSDEGRPVPLAIPPKPGDIGRDNGTGGAMFSTGSGRTLSVQQSSIQKARSLLEEGNVSDKASCGSKCFPMFRTGSGKSVQVRESSIKKAAALLEVTNDKEGCPNA
ncbi:hypothetical protein M5K25_016482 [Dendrobium thyrsiflorum]|uniref:Uncharacterized protein n=1 Tax=Dendrobium thyrsiflorum TaxID=117978 RepID=A0ABD0UKB7_DENTH